MKTNHYSRPGRIITVNGHPNVVEANDPGVSGNLTRVEAENGSSIYIRENMDVIDALRYGQAALDAKDMRISTVVRDGRRFPTYESNPAIERQRQRTFASIGAEVEVALRGNKTADTVKTHTGVEVTKPIREKYPFHYRFRLVWRPVRTFLVNLCNSIAAALRRI